MKLVLFFAFVASGGFLGGLALAAYAFTRVERMIFH